MNSKIDEELKCILRTADCFCTKADMFMELLDIENIFDIMTQIPSDFRDKFIEFARKIYLPLNSEEFSSLSKTSFQAIRYWFKSHN